jgi:PhnB protein
MATKVSLAPMLTVINGSAAVEYYTKAFGAAVHDRIDTPDGQFIIAILSIDGADFFVSEEAEENKNVSPESIAGKTTVRMELEIEDPDTFAKNAIALGAKEMFPVKDRDYGRRDGRTVDPFGHQWVVGRAL